MNKTYWRVSYMGIGIYEALKNEIWKKCKFPKKEWDRLKKSEAFVWLNTPNVYYENCYSYFTELGYELFRSNTYLIFIKYLDEKNINIDKFIFDDTKLDILYSDEHQIVIKK